MNCRPGDLAIIIREAKTGGTIGKIVNVLYLAPRGRSHLPDGYPHERFNLMPSWVVEFRSPVVSPTKLGTRKSIYGVCSDRYLRPIRPGDLDEDIITADGLPQHLRDILPV